MKVFSNFHGNLQVKTDAQSHQYHKHAKRLDILVAFVAQAVWLLIVKSK